MAYIQQPKSPTLKALKGNQPNLNAGLRAAIEAAPESPAQKKGPTPAEKKKMAQEKRINDFKKGLTSAKKPIPTVAKQTTAGEFAHQQYEMDKKTGKATRDIDKVKSVWDAITTDKTYSEAKAGYRKKQKEKYNNMSNVEKVITKATSRQNSYKK
jgi:membrane-bound lytic murein transglycosylase